jgi:hypothetical protein
MTLVCGHWCVAEGVQLFAEMPIVMVFGGSNIMPSHGILVVSDTGKLQSGGLERLTMTMN